METAKIKKTRVESQVAAGPGNGGFGPRLTRGYKQVVKNRKRMRLDVVEHRARIGWELWNREDEWNLESPEAVEEKIGDSLSEAVYYGSGINS